MSDIQSRITGFLSQIDHTTSANSALKQFEGQTGLPRSYGVLGGVTLYLLLVFLNVGGIGQLLSNVAGFVVPAYYSLQALETSTSKDDTQLLTYWVVFAFLNVAEFWSKAILYWIPFYWLFKTIGLLYLAVPSTGGAQLIYVNMIKPFAQKYVTSNSVAESLAEKLEEAAEGVSSAVEH